VDIVLGVSTTPTTVRMVLVEGDEADGLTVDNDVFDITAIDGGSASERVSAAVLGTQESAAAAGHHLVATGVTWSDDTEAAALRESLAARGLDDVMLVSELHAAGALAEAVGRALGYHTTALMFIERDTATLSVVDGADGSIVKMLSRSLHSSNAMAELTEELMRLETRESRPQGLFVIGSGVDISSVKSHLESRSSLPVSAPEDTELALARGAALASANPFRFEASTVGLAYSQDPDGTTAGATGPLELADVPTQLALVGKADANSADSAGEFDGAQDGRKLFLPVGSLLTAFFVVGVVALVMSFAISIRPTADQRPGTSENAILPSTAAAAPPAAPKAALAQSPPAVQVAQPAPEQPAPEIPTPVSVEQQAPRTVVVEPPAMKAQAPAPAAAASVPVAVDPPVAVATALPAPVVTQVAVAPALPAPAVTPVAVAPAPPAPVVTPPLVTPALAPPAVQSPLLTPAPIRPPVQGPSGPLSSWPAPSLWINAQPSQQQQLPPAAQTAPWLQIPLWPQQQSPQQTPQSPPTVPWLQIPLWPQQQGPQVQIPQSPPAPLFPRLPQSAPAPQLPVQRSPFGSGASGSDGSGSVNSGGADRVGGGGSGRSPEGGSRTTPWWPFGP
jgi:hypothetical protein